MYSRLLTTVAIAAFLSLGACGDKDEGPSDPGDNPFGVSDGTPSSTSPTPGDWTGGRGLPEGMPNMGDPAAMKEALKGLGLENMPALNDKEAMREWTNDMTKRGAEVFDRLAGEVSEDDLKKWSELKGEIKAAEGDASKFMALSKRHGGMMNVMRIMKVPAALRAYELRRDANRLTDKDKANAAIYEKYLKELE